MAVKIEIEEYNPQWEEIFSVEKEHIRQVLGEFNPVIEHIGSTSVKGLGAKPVIDILVGLPNESFLDLLEDKMISIGYTYYKIYDEIMPERRLFTKLVHKDGLSVPEHYVTGDIEPRDLGYIPKVNCHCTTVNNDFWNRHIAFRNYLQNNDYARDEYYKLKTKLAENDWQSVNDYAYAKTEFIKSIESKALNK